MKETRRTDKLRRARLRGLAFITVAATAVISFSSVQHLAEAMRFGWLSWLFPVTLDAVAAFGMDVWMRRSKAQHSAATLALSAITLSLAANVTDHYQSTHLVLAAVLGAIPPAMLAALLLVLHRHGEQVPVPLPVPEPVPAPTPGPMARVAPPVPLAPHHPVAPAGPTTPVPVPLASGASTSRRGGTTTDDRRTGVLDPMTGASATRERRPVPPETDSERTQVMAPVGAKVSEPGETRSKAQPAARTQRLVSVPVEGLSSAADNATLAAAVASRDGMSRRQVMNEFGVGSARATVIIRMAREVA